jgi:hypothetical protein
MLRHLSRTSHEGYEEHEGPFVIFVAQPVVIFVVPMAA